MSEYQYYEFAAIDRPLSRKEMAELRAVSTRADITPRGFANHYEWGELKADPADWMRRYFDAYVYLANWCSCQLSLRLPKTAFRKAELAPFANAFSLTIDASETHWIIDWVLPENEDYDRFAVDDGTGWMRRLVALREELSRGDLRPLYLGWLAAGAFLDDEDLEPDVPPGLTQLSPAQQALVEFLQVDQDLLAAAIAGSAAAASQEDDESRHIPAWLDTWAAPDMQDVLKCIALGQGQDAERRVKAHYAAWLKAQRPASSGTSRRTVAELRRLAQAAAATRQVRETGLHEEREAKRRQQREAELREVMARPDKYWKVAAEEASRGNASGYRQAVQALAVLAEGYALVPSAEAFERDLRRFLVPYASRTALLRRLAEAGLWSG